MSKVWQIGEIYTNEDACRKGNTVVRPAVYQHGKYPMIITSEPCCHNLRKIEVRYIDMKGTDARPWMEKCGSCKWHYEVEMVTTGRVIDLGGLYGVKWTSLGY